MQKKILAIHDLSCLGRCSLTVALPILSACAHSCSVLPTAVLSTHTGEFKDYVVHDLSEQIMPIAEHLKQVSLGFDAIYTGYLADSNQIESIIHIFKMLGTKDSLKFVDPAFADHGKLYSLMDNKMVENMRKLICHADLIIPNATEALMLCGSKLSYDKLTAKDAKRICLELASMGPENVVITGAISDDTYIENIAYCKSSKIFYSKRSKRYPGIFHGTGDVIASAILGILLHGKSLSQALSISSDFMQSCIESTIKEGIPLKYGVCFEKCLSSLIEECSLNEA